MTSLDRERLLQLKKYSRRLSSKAGVYCMLNENGKVIYVGKAKNLKKRVSSYFGKTTHLPKIQAVLSATGSIEVTITRTEREALILENNLIKEHKPRFNVLLKDGKSYPYIEVTVKDNFPRFSFHRGKKNRERAEYFGPYPNVNAVRDTLSQLQKIFRLRNCEDSFYNNRSRPCLQHQIKRCSAPCVGLVEEKDYAFDVNQAVEYLKGNNQHVFDEFLKKMDQASSEREYEKAAFYRNQISSLKVIQAHQFADSKRQIDLDAVAITQEADIFCVAVLFVRGGRILGSRKFYPAKTKFASKSEVLESFLVQYYLDKDPPSEIVLDSMIDHKKAIEEALSDGMNHKVAIKVNVRKDRKRWLEIAVTNAQESLSMKLSTKATTEAQLFSLTNFLQLDDVVTRVECFDISHTTGDKCIAACVGLNQDGFDKKQYRRFNISGITPGDDYAAISQAVSRHYSRLIQDDKKLPDVVVIDGGKGQLRVAKEILNELGLSDIPVIGIAKGLHRKPGEEKIFLNLLNQPLAKAQHSPAMYLLQVVRDEAHRFAITGHRAKKRKTLLKSDLESIEGIGPAKKKNLIRQFGGIQEVQRASIEDLLTIDGINKSLAERIYNFFNAG